MQNAWRVFAPCCRKYASTETLLKCNAVVNRRCRFRYAKWISDQHSHRSHKMWPITYKLYTNRILSPPWKSQLWGISVPRNDLPQKPRLHLRDWGIIKNIDHYLLFPPNAHHSYLIAPRPRHCNNDSSRHPTHFDVASLRDLVTESFLNFFTVKGSACDALIIRVNWSAYDWNCGYMPVGETGSRCI